MTSRHVVRDRESSKVGFSTDLDHMTHVQYIFSFTTCVPNHEARSWGMITLFITKTQGPFWRA